MKAVLLALTLAVPVSAATGKTEAPKLFPKTAFSLPQVKGMRLDWVLPPIDQPEKAREATAESGFAVDPHGNPWFGNGPRRLFLSPKQDLVFRTMGQFQSFAFAGGTDLVACDDDYLVSPTLPDKPKYENGAPLMDMVGMVKLDHGDCRLFPAGPHGLYLVLRDGDGRDVITLIVSRRGSRAKFRRFLRVAGPGITALSGDGDRTYYAEGKSIYEFKMGAKKPVLFFDAPDEVRSLAYSARTGLFYATTKVVGFASRKFQMELITSPDPQIALRGPDLFIRLSRTLAVLKLSAADQIKYLRWPSDKKTPARGK